MSKTHRSYLFSFGAGIGVLVSLTVISSSVFGYVRSTAATGSHRIITRHDVSQQRFFELGKQFRDSIVNLNVVPNVPDCMATFLTKRWIITAAHCAALVEAKLKKDGRHQVEFKGKYFQVDRVVLEPRYETPRSVQDVALIRLEKTVSDAKPIEVIKNLLQMRERIFVVGYGDKGTGLTGPDGNDRNLRAGTNMIDGVSENWIRFAFDTPDSGNATELEAISGPGDSGGPAFVRRGSKYFVAGISSRQSTRATGGREGLYGVTEFYTNLSSYRQWITEVLQVK